VLERLRGEPRWAYTTVKTLLDRLVEKGVLSVRKRGNAGLYQPLMTQAQARRGALRALLDRAFDGAFGSLVQHMVAEERLDARERAELAALLEREARPAGRARARRRKGDPA
jgi:BlaI family transcriptional regulator, penicillinase repressor